MSTVTPALKLHGFNNLAKTLGVSLYLVDAVEPSAFSAYARDIDKRFSAAALAGLLTHVTELIGASILNLASQDYDPQGASATLLIAEPETLLPSSLVGHLDKSHMAIHTYPEVQPVDGMAVFRADIDIATCGLISPLKSLDFLLAHFRPDVVTIDYRIRGMTRNESGAKCFADHAIGSIQDFISDEARARFQMEDSNLPQARMFYTRLLARPAQPDKDEAREAEKMALFQAGLGQAVSSPVSCELELE